MYTAENAKWCGKQRNSIKHTDILQATHAKLIVNINNSRINGGGCENVSRLKFRHVRPCARVYAWPKIRAAGDWQISDFSSRKRKLLSPTGWTFHYRIPRAIRAPRNPSPCAVKTEPHVDNSVVCRSKKGQGWITSGPSISDRHASFPGLERAKTIGPDCYVLGIYSNLLCNIWKA